MPDATDLSMWQWLANLLGPGGFVAVLCLGALGWWHMRCVRDHRDERKELHNQCHVTITTLQLEKKEIRRNVKDQWAIVNAFKETAGDLVAEMRESRVNRRTVKARG